MTMDRYANRDWWIYALVDPRDGNVRYVGWTVNLAGRLRGHICDSMRREHTRKSRWINKLIRHGLRPKMEVLESGNGCGWQQAEQRWIKLCSESFELTNATQGGEGQVGVKASTETRIKMSIAGKGRRHSDAARRNMSAAQKGRKKPNLPTKEMKDTMSELHPFHNRTHCKMGHLYDDNNTYYTVRESNLRLKRACRKCRAERQRAYMERRRSK